MPSSSTRTSTARGSTRQCSRPARWSCCARYLSQALLFGVQAVELRSRAGGEGCDPRNSLAPLAIPLYEAVKETLGRTPDDQRPLIWNDDEQSLEQFVDILSADIADEGRIVDAVRPVIGMLAVRRPDGREKGACS